MAKSRIWGADGLQGRALQALALAFVAAASIILPAVGGTSGSVALAQQGPPPLRAHVGNTVLLPGALPQALHSAKRLGSENAQMQLQLTISLRFSDPVGLTALVAAQHAHASAQYHQYLTSQAFSLRFSPTAQSVSQVRQFLLSAGLKITGISANRTLIDASGSVAQVERAFGVTINQYQLGKRKVYGPDRPPQIPDTLSNIVLDVGGLNNIFQLHPELAPSTAATATASAHASARQGGGPVPGAFGPTELRSAYDVASLIGASGTGAGQRVAVYELAPYIPSDITSYRTQYSLPSSTINNISVDGASPTCATPGSACDNGSGILEADLDMQVVSAIAPNATQDIYSGPNTFSGVLDTYNQIVLNNVDAVTTTSWGTCEPYAGNYDLLTLDQIFAQAAAQGQTIAAAAGDSGSDDCYRASGFMNPPNVDSPADDPYVLGVGGTTLTLNSGNYSSETTWNSGNAATGGGISSYFSQPSWQVGGGVVNSYSTGERLVPDVAADANPNTGYSEYCSSVTECGGPTNPWTQIGGTSAAAPLWAGVLTDINSYLVANAITTLGWTNQTLYTLFSNSQTYTPYHDITLGNNSIDYTGTPYAGDYPATACYDMTTGMGSPDAWNIARDIRGGVQGGGGGPCPNTAPATTNLVQDGGFELPPISSPWTQYSTGGFPTIYSSGGAHTGNAAFFPCNYALCDDRVSQSITVPGTVHKATLRFWMETFSSFSIFYPSTICIDHAYVTLATPDGTVIPSGGSILASCPSSVYGYQFESFDVTSLLQAHAGQQLQLAFRGTTANESAFGFYTGWAIDDVSLTVS